MWEYGLRCLLLFRIDNAWEAAPLLSLRQAFAGGDVEIILKGLSG